MEAFESFRILDLVYFQIPLVIIFIKILHWIWMGFENYSRTNYNVNDPIIVQNCGIHRYVRMPERKVKILLC